jgi:hypothetical protein
VTDATTSAAIGGATVTLTGGAGAATTNAQGAYAIASVPPGTFTLTVTAAGYQTATQQVTVASGQAVTANVLLSPSPGTVSGTVTDSVTGNALAGATVSTQPVTTTATTDNAGHFSLLLAPGAYNVLVTSARYNANFTAVSVNSNATSTVTLSLVPVPPGVAEDLFSRPNQSGIGTASDGHVWTDDSAQNPTARFSIVNRQLSVQTGSAVAYDAWMGTSYQDQEIAADFSIASGSGARVMARVQGPGSWILVAVNPGSGLVLWVTKANAWTNLASANVPVSLNTAYHAKIDVIGTLVQAKVWQVGTSEPGWQVAATQSILTGTGVAGLRTSGSSVTYSSLTQTPITQISGTVTTAAGSPIAGAPITLGGGAQTTTDSSGRFTFASLAPGTYTVTASPQGSTPQSQIVPVGLGVSANVRFKF